MLDNKNLKLRSEYRRKAHDLWTSKKNGNDSWKEARQIKRELLRCELKVDELPAKIKFYSYRNFSQWDHSRLVSEIDDIKQNRITLVQSKFFNDPYDSLIPLRVVKAYLEKAHLPSNRDKFRKITKKAVAKTFLGLSRAERRKIEKMYEKRTKYDLSNPNPDFVAQRREGLRDLMVMKSLSTKLDSMYFWSHYASSHRGFCIEYEVEDEFFDQFFHPIEYVEEWPRDFYESIPRSGANCAFTLVKSMDWAAECEWRLLNMLKEEDVTGMMKSPIKITAIYLGLDFIKNDEKLKKPFLEFCQNCDKEIYPMKLGSDNFKIEVGKKLNKNLV